MLLRYEGEVVGADGKPTVADDGIHVARQHLPNVVRDERRNSACGLYS